jgi:hypothetical protein
MSQGCALHDFRSVVSEVLSFVLCGTHQHTWGLQYSPKPNPEVKYSCIFFSICKLHFILFPAAS